MSDVLVRRGLEKHLAGMSGVLADTIYENDQRAPPADAATPYQKCHLLPAQPDNTVMGSGVYRAHGIFQVSLLYQLGTGSAAAGAMAELLRTRFRRGTTVTEGSLNVLVTDTPRVASGIEDNGRWHVPVSISWQAWVTIA